jgi:two-component system phosphate regulon response regulator PhoB
MTRVDDMPASVLTRDPSLHSLRTQILDWLDELEGWPAVPDSRVVLRRELPTIDEYGLLRRGDRWVSLTPTEERVMRVLLERAGRVCSRELLTDVGWPHGPANERILDTYVRRLRAKIPEFGVEIRTVRKRGFLLDVVGAAV